MGLRACLNRSKKIEKPLRIGSVWSDKYDTIGENASLSAVTRVVQERG